MKLVNRIVIITLLAATWASAELPSGVSGTRPSLDGEATEVIVAPFLIDVSRVTGADQSFTADLFVLMTWRDHRLEGVFETEQRVPLDEVWNPRLQVLNRRDIETTFPEQAEITPDGQVTYRQRYFGSFSAPLDLHDFPLDRQRFIIRLVVPGYSPEEVRLVTAPPELMGKARTDAFSIADWKLDNLEIRPEPFRVTANGRAIAGYLVSIDGHRYLGFWSGKAFVSVAIIVAMSWIVFWIDPKFVAPRLSVAVTSMLTLIAYRFLLGSVLPRLSYLTRMDFFLIGATLLVLVTVVQVAITTHQDDKDHHRRAARLNRASRWFFPAAFVVLLFVSFWAV
jgi:hypothetical protein